MPSKQHTEEMSAPVNLLYVLESGLYLSALWMTQLAIVLSTHQYNSAYATPPDRLPKWVSLLREMVPSSTDSVAARSRYTATSARVSALSSLSGRMNEGQMKARAYACASEHLKATACSGVFASAGSAHILASADADGCFGMDLVSGATCVNWDMVFSTSPWLSSSRLRSVFIRQGGHVHFVETRITRGHSQWISACQPRHPILMPYRRL